MHESIENELHRRLAEALLRAESAERQHRMQVSINSVTENQLMDANALLSSLGYIQSENGYIKKD
jgi:hypothetical protein